LKLKNERHKRDDWIYNRREFVFFFLPKEVFSLTEPISMDKIMTSYTGWFLKVRIAQKKRHCTTTQRIIEIRRKL